MFLVKSCCERGYVMRRKEASSQVNRASGNLPSIWEASGKPHQKALLAAMKEGDFLELAVSTIGDIFLVFDLDGTLVGYNERTKSLTGYSDEELNMKPLGVLTCPEDEAPKVHEAFRLALAGDVSKVETWLLCKDGSRVPIEYWSTPLRDRDGCVIGAVAIGRDLSERRRAEAALAEREKQFRALIENSSDIVEIIDSSNRIAYMSPSVQRVLGYRPEEMIGRSGLEFNHPDEFEMITATITKIVETGTPGTVTFRCRHKDGSWRVFEGIGSLLPSRAGDWQLVVNIRDITKRTIIENALAEANRELEILAKTVIHDVMAPLSAINIAGQRLDEFLQSSISEDDLGMAREMVSTIREGVRDAIGLTTDIVSLLRIESKPGSIEPVDVSNVVNRVIAQHGPAIEARGVDVRVDAELGTVLANPTHIYQLFVNLISNAVKYNDSIDPILMISRLDYTAGGAHRYLVRDNGPGIPLELVESIFLPFVRGRSGGTGLGLATVQKVVKLYKGDISVYNDDGACFEFTLRDAGQ
jgi:PAS domain S-box-containing protein